MLVDHPKTEALDDASLHRQATYVPALDGLKAVGLIMMLFGHAGVGWARGAIFTISFFFTLSGFLITSLLLEEHRANGSVDMRAFWIRRFRRLLPAALLVLIGVVIFGTTVADETQRTFLTGDVTAALGYVANWRFIASGQTYLQAYRTPSPVLHFWSLAIEEQFYFAFPLLVAGCIAFTRRSRHRSGYRSHRSRRGFESTRLTLGIAIALLILASIAVTVWGGFGPDRVYLGTDTRAAELLMGALLAVLLCGRPLGTPTRSRIGHRTLSIMGPIAVVAMFCIWVLVPRNAGWIYRGGFPLFAFLSVVVVAAGTDPRNPVSRIFKLAALAWVGRRAYGIYLLHFPLFLWLSPQRTGLGFWPLFVLRVSATFALAYLSFRYLEEPMRRGTPIFGQSLKHLAPVVATVIVVAMLAMTTTRGLSTAAAVSAHPSAFRASPSSSIPRVVGVEQAARPLRLMIVGDSSAVFLTWALGEWNGAARNFDISSYALMGCGLVRGGTEVAAGIERDLHEDCSNWPEIWAKGLAEAAPDVVMMAGSFHDATDRRLSPTGPMQHVGQAKFDRVVLDAMTEAADLLHATGAPILWLDNPPVREGQNLPESNIVDGPGNDPRRMDRMNSLLDRLTETRPFVHQIAYATFYKTWPGGPFDPRIRQDGIHVDYEGRTIVGQWLGPRLLEAARRVTASR